MAAFKGRSTLKQYCTLKKTIKREFKIWAAACCITGILLKFDVYTGKKKGHTELGLGEKVVKMLSETYTNQSRRLFFDYFISSINLFDILLQKDTFACATIRFDRVEYPQVSK